MTTAIPKPNTEMETARLVRQWKENNRGKIGAHTRALVVSKLGDRGQLIEFAIELFKASTRQEAIRDLLILKNLFELKEH